MIAILDIDNTLFDWLGMWSGAFDAAMAVLGPKSTHDRETLLDEVRRLHQQARTSERGFVGDDAEVLGVPKDIAARAGEAFEQVAAEAMQPFPGVIEGLEALRRRGVRVVLHSDSPPVLVRSRVHSLGLTGIAERTFASDQTATVHRREFVGTSVALDLVPHRKPEADALRHILGALGVPPASAIYLGDSKTHDIPMARNVGVRAVFAEYGCRRHLSEYDLLRRVTHWTDEDVERERHHMKQEPDHSIVAFGELAGFFD